MQKEPAKVASGELVNIGGKLYRAVQWNQLAVSGRQLRLLLKFDDEEKSGFSYPVLVPKEVADTL